MKDNTELMIDNGTEKSMVWLVVMTVIPPGVASERHIRVLRTTKCFFNEESMCKVQLPVNSWLHGE
jgi:hypothetical protein